MSERDQEPPTTEDSLQLPEPEDSFSEFQKKPSDPTNIPHSTSVPSQEYLRLATLNPLILERSIAFISLLVDRKLAEEEIILEILKSFENQEALNQYSLEQKFLSQRLLKIDHYLAIQKELNDCTLGCVVCEGTTYKLSKKDSPGFCTKCLLEKKSSESLSLDTEEVASRMAIVETYFSIRKSGLVGKIIEGYEILEELGRGGMGVVYKARHIPLDRLVALKVIREAQVATARQIQRFLKEAKTLATLRHPNIVSIYDIGSFGDQYYFTMDFIAGRPLSQLIKQKELSFYHAARILRDTAYAVEYAHSRGVVHRDLKPANIMIDAEGKPVVMDFGLVKVLGENDEDKLTRTGAVVGTPVYMAPEQVTGAFGAIDGQTDVYALGVILYEMLAGVPPFVASSNVLIYKKIMEEEPQDLRKCAKALPKDLDTLCRKALEKSKEKRYPSASEFAADLERFLNHEPIKATRPSLLERGKRKVSRHPAASSLTILFLLLAILFGYMKFTEPGSIEIHSLSGKERVFIDGRKIHYSLGQGKSFEINLSAGEHSLEIRMEKHHSYAKKIEIHRGQTTVLSPLLLRKKGFLTVLTNPGVITLKIQSAENSFTFSTPLTRTSLPTGRYRLRFSKENFLSRQREIAIRDGKETSLYTSLHPMVKWKFYSDFSGPRLFALSDFSQDGYPDVLYRDGKYIRTFDGRENRKLWDLKDHLKLKSLYSNRQGASKIDLGDLIYVKSLEVPSSVEAFVLSSEQNKKILISNPDSTRMFSRLGLDLKNYSGVFSQATFGKASRIYFLLKKEIHKYTKILKIKGRLRFLNPVLLGTDYYVHFYRKGSLHPLWKRHYPYQQLQNFKERKDPLPKGIQPVLILADDYLLGLEPEKGDLIWVYKGSQKFFRQRLALVDRDGKGQRELLFVEKSAVRSISLLTGKTLWSRGLGIHGESRLIVTDLNGDGKAELIGFDSERNLTAWDRQGKILWKHRSSRPNHPENLSGADVNFDGVMDFVFPRENHILCLSGKSGKILSRFSSSEPIAGTPLLGDLDNDGSLEAVFSTIGREIYSIHLFRPLQSWYQTLSPEVRYLDGEGEFEFALSRGRIYSSRASGKLRESKNFSRKGERLIFKIPSNPGGYLYYRKDSFALQNQEGKVLWSAPFSLLGEFLGGEELEEGVFQILFKSPSSANPQGHCHLFLFLSSSGEYRLVAFYSARDNQNFSLIQWNLSTGKILGKISLAFSEALKQSLGWRPRISYSQKKSPLLYFPSPKGAVYLVDLQKWQHREKIFRSSAPGLEIRDMQILKTPDRKDWETLILTTSHLHLLSPKGDLQWSLTFYDHLKRMKMIQPGLEWLKERQVEPLRRARGEDLILLSFPLQSLSSKITDLLALDRKTGQILWATRILEGLKGPFKVMDLDGDGEDEVILLTPSRVEILSGSRGTLRWAYPLASEKILKLLKGNKSTPPFLLAHSNFFVHHIPILLREPSRWNNGQILSAGDFLPGFSKAGDRHQRKDNRDFYTSLLGYYQKSLRWNELQQAQYTEGLARQFPQSFEIQIERVRSCINLRQYRQAKSLLEDLRIHYDGNGLLLYYTALTHFGLKDYYRAYFFIEASIRAASVNQDMDWKRTLGYERFKNALLKKIAEKEGKGKEKGKGKK